MQPATLSDNARVAVVGGGPAGALTAYYLLDMAAHTGQRLRLDLYEPREFTQCGPGGCNMCGGVISESLVQILAAEGITLPPPVVIHTLDAYQLHTDQGSVTIRTPLAEMRIACIFRGGGPKGAEKQYPLPWESFDRFLLERAVQRGARRVTQRVTGLSWREGRPVVETGEEPPRAYDLLVGAPGLNSPLLKQFEGLGFGYRAPLSKKAYVAELLYGGDEVERLLGHAMHVFLLDIPGVEFAALTPKGPYGTFIVLGEAVDRELAERVLAAPEVKRLFPLGWELPVQPCSCLPRIQVGDPRNPFGERVVMVGDASVSRLYKDGIGAAYRTAKAAAMTALFYGVSRDDFARHYQPVCRGLSWDNRLGHLVFATVGLVRRFPFLRRMLMHAVAGEQRSRAGGRPLSGALWDTFTGSAPYREILVNVIHPRAVVGLLAGVARALTGRGPGESA